MVRPRGILSHVHSSDAKKASSLVASSSGSSGVLGSNCASSWRPSNQRWCMRWRHWIAPVSVSYRIITAPVGRIWTYSVHMIENGVKDNWIDIRSMRPVITHVLDATVLATFLTHVILELREKLGRIVVWCQRIPHVVQDHRPRRHEAQLGRGCFLLWRLCLRCRLVVRGSFCLQQLRIEEPLGDSNRDGVLFLLAVCAVRGFLGTRKLGLGRTGRSGPWSATGQ
jgi:hypothetical protein